MAAAGDHPVRRHRACAAPSRARVAATGRLLAAEMLVFGRIARGERWTGGALARVLAGRARRRARLVRCAAPRRSATIDRPAGFGGAEAFATIALCRRRRRARICALARDAAPSGTCRAGATLVNGMSAGALFRRGRVAYAHRLGALCRRAAPRGGRAGARKPPRVWNDLGERHESDAAGKRQTAGRDGGQCRAPPARARRQAQPSRSDRADHRLRRRRRARRTHASPS